MEILPNVHSLPAAAAIFMGVYAPNVYLVADGEGALVDSGYGDEEAVGLRVETLRDLGVRLSYIVITHPHPDHIGGAEGIRERTGAQMVMHPKAGLTPPSPGLLVGDGDLLRVGGLHLQVIHTPGHHPGHICLYLRERGVLFSGDNILGVGTTAISPAQGDMAQYLETLRRLLNYELRLICPAHGPLIRQPRHKIQELINHRLERERQVLTLLERGVGRVEGLVAEIYPELDERLHEMARDQVRAHLVKLEREGRVAPSGQDEYTLK